MKEFNDKRKIKKILYSKLSILLLLIVFVVIAKACFRVYQKEEESYRNRAKADKELRELKSREAKVAGEIEELYTPHGIEREIREKFKMAKEGENMAVIVRDAQEEKKQEQEREKGFLKKFREKITSFFRYRD